MNLEWLKSCKMVVNKIVWRYRDKVLCEANSRVYSSCCFEGRNRICRDSYISNTSFGFGSYVGINAFIISAKIGRFSSIGPHVRITSGKHPIDGFASMHPAFYSVRKQVGFTFVNIQKYNEGLDKGIHTVIGNDVWIGDSAIILEGVTVGDGAVVAAGSVVTKDVPAYAVVAGVPAKVLKYRFNKNQREELLEIQWWNKELSWIEKNADRFSNVDKLIEFCKEGERDETGYSSCSV